MAKDGDIIETMLSGIISLFTWIIVRIAKLAGMAIVGLFGLLTVGIKKLLGNDSKKDDSVS